MKKLCSKHGTYDYTEQRCPECYKERDRFRDKSNNPYDWKWQKFRKQVNQDFVYSFCWICFLTDNKWEYNVHYHHIMNVHDYPELKFELGNLVPVCAKHHTQIESQIQKKIPQPNFKSLKKAVLVQLRNLGR